jgi:hypothetical protein
LFADAMMLSGTHGRRGGTFSGSGADRTPDWPTAAAAP